jgi:AhpD family alkylhydroperoxidase
LTEKGEAALPLVVVDGKVAVSGTYPARAELGDLLGLDGIPVSLFTPAVAELVAIGAAIAANCEPCLRYHTGQAGKLGVSIGDIARAVELAARVKDAPHRNIMRLAARLTQIEPAVAVATPGACFDSALGPGDGVKGCGCS